MEKIPDVTDAVISNMPVSDGLMLPREVSVTYACNEGYELKSRSNEARCEYNMQRRKGAPDGDNTQLVTAVWRGQDDIQCEKGMCLLRVSLYHY